MKEQQHEHGYRPAQAASYADAEPDANADSSPFGDRGRLMAYFLAYIAAMFCIALPLALFAKNEVAAAVFVVWGVGQVAYQLGAPEPGTQVVLYAGAFLLLLVQRTRGGLNVPDCSILAHAMFVPLLLVCFLWWRGTTSEHEAWWAIYWLAMLQVAFLLRPIAWPLRVRRWHDDSRSDESGPFLMVRA